MKKSSNLKSRAFCILLSCWALGCQNQSSVDANYKTETQSQQTPIPTPVTVDIAFSSPSSALVNHTPTATYTVTFQKTATVNLTAALVHLNTTGSAACSVSVSSGTTTTPTISLSSCTGDGTVGISVLANAATSTDGTAATAASAAAIVTVDNTPPLAPAGLDDGSSAADLTHTPVTGWTASAGAVSYEVAVGTTSGAADILNWTNQGATTSATISGLTLNDTAKYFTSVRAIDAAGNVSAASNGDGWLTIKILDRVTTAQAAYGLRQLRQAYAGSAVQLRRSSDNVTQDFGFNSTGDLDTAAITTWLGGSNAFVTIWYDQSGNSRNLSQGGAGSQPALILNAQNGHPSVRYDGSDDFMSAGSMGGLLTPEYFSVFKIITSSNSGIFWSDSSNGYHLGSYFGTGAGPIPPTGAGFLNMLGSDGGVRASLPFSTGTFRAARVYYAVNLGTNASLLAVNGTETTFTLVTGDFASGTLNNLDMGRFNAGGHYQNGEMCELIIYPAGRTAAQRLTVESSFKIYWNLP